MRSSLYDIVMDSIDELKERMAELDSDVVIDDEIDEIIFEVADRHVPIWY